jgi:hypothetical protein
LTPSPSDLTPFRRIRAKSNLIWGQVGWRETVTPSGPAQRMPACFKIKSAARNTVTPSGPLQRMPARFKIKSAARNTVTPSGPAQRMPARFGSGRLRMGSRVVSTDAHLF